MCCGPIRNRKGNVVSFLVIGVFWIRHHRKFRLIRHYAGTLLMLDLLLLVGIAFVPFPTSVISQFGNQAAAIFYAVVITYTGILSAAFWWYASFHDWLIDPHPDARRRRRETWGPLAAQYAIALPSRQISLTTPLMGDILIPLF